MSNQTDTRARVPALSHTNTVLFCFEKWTLLAGDEDVFGSFTDEQYNCLLYFIRVFTHT